MDERFEDALKVAGRKNDVIGIKVYDKMDVQLPEAGLMEVSDAETGQTRWIDSNDYWVMQQYEKHFFKLIKTLSGKCADKDPGKVFDSKLSIDGSNIGVIKNMYNFFIFR